ncbi:MAG TPA: nuclear transport factor 2 family protein [Kofleriaceae bacterium]|nr:nuclear transport factor 2 family protein [Kofleriaceae bacterium]
MIDHNKHVVRRMFEEILPSTDLAGIEELVDPAFVDHAPAVLGASEGIASLRATHAYLHARAPGAVRFELEDLVGEGDRVAVRWRFGQARAIAWFRLANGKIVERWALITGPRG